MISNELRIGSIVADHDGYTDRVVAILKNDIVILENYGKIYVTQLQGVPLTEEWLEFFGFEKGSNGKWYGNGTNVRLGEGGRFEFATAYSFQPNFFPRYVHQLQNLYFALTGEELTLKTK